MSEPSAKRRKTKYPENGTDQDGPKITDPRFSSIQSDPRYRLPRKRDRQVKLDKRFSRILKDEDFTRKSKVDRYGRPQDTQSEKNRLKRNYAFEEDESADDDDDVQRELERVEEKRDPLREGRDSSSESEETSSDEDEDEFADEELLALAEPQDDAIPTGEVTSRLAVVNLDWDNIRAVDLMAVFSSFLPASGRLLNVSIYPSEFGKERMEREEMEGPPKEIFNRAQQADKQDYYSEDEEEDSEEEIKNAIIKPDTGAEFDSAALRRYQLVRLRYYYAILTFSSPNAAHAVYKAADGAEYLSSANFFDLRFVPDATDFSADEARDQCEKMPDGYKPNEFITDALQHSKVKLTWDAEDGGRKEAQARAFGGSRKEIDENDLKAYLGTDSSEEEEEVDDEVVSKKEQERLKMRALLGLGPEPVKKAKKGDREKERPVGDLQITFSSGLAVADGNGKKKSVFENEPESNETTVEKYVRKERERKQKRKERLKSGGASAEGKEVEVEAEVEEQELGFDDPFFAEPQNDKASTSRMRKEERMKKRAERQTEEAAAAANRAELELLMVDDKEAEVRHFDMNEIEKAERRAKKKGKKGKKSQTAETQKLQQQEDAFEMDTQDPRFARLFENHEFAIDPTNPRFKGTHGMKKLLEEGRKRRKDQIRTSDDAGEKQSKEKDTREKVVDAGGDLDLKQLVEKVKKKS